MYTREQMTAAWRADIVTFLIEHHADEIQTEGSYCRLKSDHKVVFKGNSYYDNGTAEHGGPIDALIKYFGYSTYDAIIALSASSKDISKQSEKTAQKAPERFQGKYSRVWAYLTKTRRISPQIVGDLMHRGLLYEDDRHNAVFMNARQTAAEIRGTCTDISYKGRWGNKDYWFYQPNDKSERVYITESAIDAISLYQILGDNDAVYVSLAGVGNARRIIDSILKHGKRIIICTDNDEAGMTVRQAYPTLETIYPIYKDFNEDLQRGVVTNENNSGDQAISSAYNGLQTTA